MDRVAESHGQDIPIDYFTDECLSLSEVEQAHRAIVRLARQGDYRGDGNSAFETLLSILRLAMEKGVGLQSVAERVDPGRVDEDPRPAVWWRWQ